MSDVENQEVVQEVVETPVEKPAEVATPGNVDEGAAPADKPTARTYTQKEVDAIAARVAAREEKRAKRELEAERARWQTQATVKVEPTTITPGAPKREDFQDYEAYVEAKAVYAAEQKWNERVTASEAAQKQAKEQEDDTQALKQFDGRMREAPKKYEDFDEALAVAQTLPISDAMFKAVTRLEEGPDLVYFFGKNPQEVHRIALLHPTVQAAEIGKLAAKLANPAPKPASVSKAPPPIEPINGNSSVVGDDPPTDPNEYKAWRTAQRMREAEASQRKRA